MFKEEVNITNNKLTIKVTAEKIRKFSFEEKKVYRKDITCLIPQELRNKIKLLSEPKKLISNYKDSNFFQSGIWQFEIIENNDKPIVVEEEANKNHIKQTQIPQSSNRKTRTRRRKATTTNQTKKR